MKQWGSAFQWAHDALQWWLHQMVHFPRYWSTGHRWVPLKKASDAELWCFLLHLNKQLSKNSRRRWFETPSRSLWRHCNEYHIGRHIVLDSNVSNALEFQSFCNLACAPNIQQIEMVISAPTSRRLMTLLYITALGNTVPLYGESTSNQ